MLGEAARVSVEAVIGKGPRRRMHEVGRRKRSANGHEERDDADGGECADDVGGARQQRAAERAWAREVAHAIQEADDEGRAELRTVRQQGERDQEIARDDEHEHGECCLDIVLTTTTAT